MSGYTIYDNDFIDVQTGLMLGGVSCHSYRCHLGCILLKMPATSLLTGVVAGGAAAHQRPAAALARNGWVAV